jgi:hypothetical protein
MRLKNTHSSFRAISSRIKERGNRSFIDLVEQYEKRTTKKVSFSIFDYVEFLWCCVTQLWLSEVRD